MDSRSGELVHQAQRYQKRKRKREQKIGVALQGNLQGLAEATGDKRCLTHQLTVKPM